MRAERSRGRDEITNEHRLTGRVSAGPEKSPLRGEVSSANKHAALIALEQQCLRHSHQPRGEQHSDTAKSWPPIISLQINQPHTAAGDFAALCELLTFTFLQQL